jgi:hypothetical protein
VRLGKVLSPIFSCSPNFLSLILTGGGTKVHHVAGKAVYEFSLIPCTHNIGISNGIREKIAGGDGAPAGGRRQLNSSRHAVAMEGIADKKRHDARKLDKEYLKLLLRDPHILSSLFPDVTE